jgi:hypothetical protein
MQKFDINTYIDEIEIMEGWYDDYHCLNGQIEYWEVL